MSVLEEKQAILIAKMVSEGKISPYQALTNENVSEAVREKVEGHMLKSADHLDYDEYHKNNAWKHGLSTDELELVPKDEDVNRGQTYPARGNVSSIDKIENVVEKTGWAGRVAVAGVSGAVSLTAAAMDSKTLDEFGDNLMGDAQENEYVSAIMEEDHFKLAEMGAKDIAIAAAGAAAGAIALTVSAPAIVVGTLVVGSAVVAGVAVEKGIEYMQDVDFVAVGQDVGDAIQISMTAIDTLGGQMKGGALALVDDAQELAGDVSDNVMETFDDLKDDYQQAGGITGMFNSAVSSVQNTLSNTFNTSAENNVTATVEHQPIAPGVG